jgi:predicted permease
MRLMKRLMFFLQRDRFDRELEDELSFHLEARVRENLEAGMPPAEARHDAMRRFGNATLVKENSREVWIFRFPAQLVQDLRYGLRMLRKSPGFTAVAVVTLGLGIGANTTIFSLFDAVLLKTLPVRNSRELVLLSQRAGSEEVFPFSVDVFEGLRESHDVLSGLSAFRPWPGLQVKIDGEAELAFGQLATGNYYSVLGLNALLGRTLTDADDQAAGHEVAVISYRYWQARLAGDPEVVGRAIELQGHSFTIVGVTPPEFYGTQPGRAVDITVPLAAQPLVMPGLTPMLKQRNARWLYLIGRLQPGVSRQQALALLRVRWAQSAAGGPAKLRPGTATLVLDSGAQGLNELRRQFSLPLRVLMAAVGVLLLIACTNLAGLLLARSTSRQHEIGVRRALGAGRGRLLRQFLTESVLLALAGGITGVILAYWTTDLMIAVMSRGRAPIVLDLTPDPRALAFTASVTLLTGLLFGILPALRAARAGIHSGLKGSAPTLAGAKNRWTRTIVMAQVALSLVLLCWAGLFVRSLQKLHSVDAGFRKDQVLLLSVRPGAAGYRGAKARALYDELYTRFSALPGVESVTLTMDTPLGGLSYGAGISIPGRSAEGLQGDDGPQVYHNHVGSRFFETLGIPVVSGRDFDARDDERAPQRVVIGESVARRYFSGINPLGREILIGGTRAEIIGVAKDVRYSSLREPAAQMIYRPYHQQPAGVNEMTFCLRASMHRERLTPFLRREVRAVSRDLPVASIRTLDEQVDATLVEERILAMLSSCFGALAVILASIGLYGTLAYAVVQCTREIGIRMALGADPRHMSRLLLGEALWLVAGGLTLGVAASWVVARLASNLLSGLLFELKPNDPLTIAISTLPILAAAILASYLPARRAARVDPMVTLRDE